VTWQAPGRALWPPGPGHLAVAPIGRVAPGPGIWSVGAGTRQAQSPGGLTAYGRGDSLLEAAWSRQFIYVFSFMRIRHLGFFLIDLFSDYKTDIHCCGKGPLIIIKFSSMLLVRSPGRAARACLSVTVMPGPPVTVTVTRPGHWNGPVTWQARGLWSPKSKRNKSCRLVLNLHNHAVWF
jgi:hypothetical protein